MWDGSPGCTALWPKLITFGAAWSLCITSAGLRGPTFVLVCMVAGYSQVSWPDWGEHTPDWVASVCSCLLCASHEVTTYEGVVALVLLFLFKVTETAVDWLCRVALISSDMTLVLG